MKATNIAFIQVVDTRVEAAEEAGGALAGVRGQLLKLPTSLKPRTTKDHVADMSRAAGALADAHADAVSSATEMRVAAKLQQGHLSLLHKGKTAALLSLEAQLQKAESELNDKELEHFGKPGWPSVEARMKGNIVYLKEQLHAAKQALMDVERRSEEFASMKAARTSIAQSGPGSIARQSSKTATTTAQAAVAPHAAAPVMVAGDEDAALAAEALAATVAAGYMDNNDGF